MIYGSVCSGIEAATVAWEPLGWKPAFFSEIDKFPRAVLEHHYPDVPLHGDFTTIGNDDYGSIELFVGGTPCQSFSIAGLRGGMADERGNLALEYLKLAQRKRPRWLVWENVPGVLSSNGGGDFGAFLGGLVELGYGFAYRILNAQYFGVPQRRNRVFVVGYLGDWRRAAAVLFERHSLQGHSAPGRKSREAITEGTVSRALTSSHTATGRSDPNETTFIPVSVHGTQDPDTLTELAHTLGRNNGQENALCFQQNQRDEVRIMDVAGALAKDHGAKQQNYIAQPYSIMPQNSGKDYKARPVQTAQPVMAGGPVGGNQGGDYIAKPMALRKLTPTECERLQGFPDGYTQIPYRNKPADKCPDGPRYKALGNSMAVPVMHWIGQRIEQVERINHPTQGV